MQKRWWLLSFIAVAALTLIYVEFGSERSDSANVVDELLQKERRLTTSQPAVDGPAVDGIAVDGIAKNDQVQGSHSRIAASEQSPPQVDEETLEVELAKDKQKHIWDLEHLTFELEWKFGKIVKRSIKERNKEGLLACFRSGFQGAVPTSDHQQSTEEPWWHQTLLRSVEESAVQLQASQEDVVDLLVDSVSTWKEIRKVGLRVLAIDRDPDVPDQYKLKILLTASGVDADSGPVSLDSTHQVHVEFAEEAEIAEGKIVTRWSTETLETRGANEQFFEEVTKQAKLQGLDLPDNWKLPSGSQVDSYTNQVAVDDFDRDGYLDIAVSSLQGQQYLLRSVRGEHFEDVTEQCGLPKKRFFSHTTFATWIDYDNDLYPDLLIGKNLYHNEGGKKFKRATSSSGLRFESATMGAVVADYDCDGWTDLYVLNHLGDRKGKKIGFVDDDKFSGSKNQLWRNLGNGKFEDVTEQAGVDGDERHSFAAAWFYANADRFPDLYLVNDFGRNCMYINRGDGRFDEVAEQAGVGDFANSMGVATGDLNNDGTSEIYVANMFSKMGKRIIAHVCEQDYPEGIYSGIQGACAGSHLYQRVGEDQFYHETSLQKQVNEIGWAYAPVFADFDADGLLDIYATSGFISVDRRKPDG